MNSGVSKVVIETAPHTAAIETHYSVTQVAAAWNLSADAVRRLFEKEPGVLVIEAPGRSRFSRRRYRTIRIPANVVERVHRRLSVVSSTQQNPARSAK